ncbi:MAG: fused MFS/spermidine synthase [Flavobacteriaceae bacterium]|nr:fused MFS/spermidine synthase [Flavobacteriaceae bacterium]
MITSKKNYLYLLSFLEGGAVMACELIGAKLLAPFFGTSLYVWASALALTLGGLTLGYFIGGRLSKKFSGSTSLLYWVMISAGILLVLMPYTSDLMMNATINLSLEAGAIFSLMIFMLPPLMFMGMVSPIIINLLTSKAKTAGNNAGNVYAISTLGGILMTFLMGFYIIPNFGLSLPAVITGVLLSLLPIISLMNSKNVKVTVPIILLSLSSFISLAPNDNFNEEYNVLYQSEGILGQVKVVDHPSYEITPDARMGRGLIVNNTLQTYVGVADDLQYSIWSWANYFPTAASIFPEKSKVLLLGLGGGTLVKQLDRLGYETDVVEIDQRIADVSYEYFNMDRSTNVVIDDARHYVKTTSKKYDIVIFDTFLSEAVPEHLITVEGFEDTKKIMNPGGMIMINFYGFIKGRKGIAARSVLRTLEHSGYKVEILATPGEAQNRNLIFIASEDYKDFSSVNYDEPNFDKIEDLYDYFIDLKFINTEDAKILTDRKPQLAKLYTEASKEWKKGYNAYYRKHFMRK